MKKIKLGDIGSVRMCKRILKEETNSEGGIPFYKISTFGNVADVFIDKDKYENYKTRFSYPKKGEVLISAAGTIGRTVIYNGEDAYFQDSNIVWIENEEKEVLNSFLYYAYQNVRWKTSNGSTILRLYNDDLRNTEILIPEDISEQKRIAKVLSNIDRKISINREINRNLEELAKQIYDYWFVQFDFPNEEGKPYKSSGGKMVYNELLKREIPEGWEVRRISLQIKENIGGDWGKEAPEGNYQLKVSCCRGADLVSMTDLPTRYILNSNYYKLLEEDDMIVEISGGSPTQATGRCVLISKEILNSFNNKLICSNFCQALSISDKDYVSYFYYMWKMFYNSDVFFNFEGKTSGIKNFQYDTFVAEKWYFPPKDLAKKFKEIVSQNYIKKCALDQENKHLAALRDELLPLLMNGQVTLNSCLSAD